MQERSEKVQQVLEMIDGMDPLRSKETLMAVSCCAVIGEENYLKSAVMEKIGSQLVNRMQYYRESLWCRERLGGIQTYLTLMHSIHQSLDFPVFAREIQSAQFVYNLRCLRRGIA